MKPATSATSAGEEHTKDRPSLLVECIDNALALNAPSIVVAVLTNEPEATWHHLAREYIDRFTTLAVTMIDSMSSFKGPFRAERQIVVVGWRPRTIYRHGRYMTWAHKLLFRNVLDDPGLSLFVYLEDDLRFTNDNLHYWNRFREPLAAHGLLPGFVRFERKGDTLYVLDQIWRQSFDRTQIQCRPADGGSGRVFVGLDQLHQGMYILDKDLARYHLRESPARDPLRSRTLVSWPAIERSAIGPMFDHLPHGFESRYVVPVRDANAKSPMLDAPCLIEHTAGNYSRSAGSIFGKIRLDELFI